MQTRRKGGLLWFGLALVFAMLAAWFTHSYIAANTRTSPALVAVRAVRPLDPISRDDVKVVNLPAAAVPDDALRSVSDVAGAYAAVGLVPGQIVQRAAVMVPGGPAASMMDARITQLAQEAQNLGLRAVPLALDEPHGYTLIRAGDRVDVFATVKLASGSTTTLVAQQVPVMAKLDAAQSNQSVGLPGSGSPQSADHGTVVLTTDQATAERILMAAELGKVTLALAPSGSQATTGTPPSVSDQPGDWGVGASGGPAPSQTAPVEGGQ